MERDFILSFNNIRCRSNVFVYHGHITHKYRSDRQVSSVFTCKSRKYHAAAFDKREIVARPTL
jgi:hypothetical protein